MIKKGERGQVKMSFGMIFSIILIIIFLAFAFYAIRTFLGIGNSATAGKFISDIQSDIDRIWRSAESSEQQEYFIPSKILYVCFVDFDASATGANAGFYNELRRAYSGSENMIFYPLGSSGIESAEIRNIDLGLITQSKNPYCIESSEGRVKLFLSKDFNEALVKIR